MVEMFDKNFFGDATMNHLLPFIVGTSLPYIYLYRPIKLVEVPKVEMKSIIMWLGKDINFGMSKGRIVRFLYKTINNQVIKNGEPISVRVVEGSAVENRASTVAGRKFYVMRFWDSSMPGFHLTLLIRNENEIDFNFEFQCD